MLIPFDRPAGSAQVLRYRGQIVAGETVATYPKTNATFPSDSHVAGGFFTAWVRFALFNPSDPSGATDPLKMLPGDVYDDGVPAASEPSKPVSALVSVPAGINTSDQTLNQQTWAKNLEIHYTCIDTNVVLADIGVSVSNDPANGAMVLQDAGASSGLGTNTGMPVIAVKFFVKDNGDGGTRPFNVDLTFEIRHSAHR